MKGQGFAVTRHLLRKVRRAAVDIAADKGTDMLFQRIRGQMQRQVIGEGLEIEVGHGTGLLTGDGQIGLARGCRAPRRAQPVWLAGASVAASKGGAI
jgi:hypothetical protein